MQSPTARNLIPSLYKAALISQDDRFQRLRGVLTPAVTLLSLMIFSSIGCPTGYDGLMTTMFIVFGEKFKWTIDPRGSSFCRARKKITEDMFARFRLEVMRMANPTLSLFLPRVGDYRIVAIDGTWISVPNSTILRRLLGIHCIGPKRCPMKNPQILMVVLTDAITRMPIARVYLPGIGSEREAAKELLKHLKPDDILVVDRGYEGRELLHMIHDTGCRYALRVSGGGKAWREFRGLQRRRIRDAHVTVNHQGSSVTVRHLRIGGGPGRPRKGTKRETMFLLTNLPRSWSVKKIEWIYRTRWGIETMFRELKGTLETKRFRSRDLKGIIQELDARCLHLTIACILDMATIMKHQAASKNGKMKYQTNRTTLLVIEFFLSLAEDDKGMKARAQIAAESASKRAQKIRQGRHAPRRKRMFA